MAELPELTDLSDNASVASSMTMRASSAPIQDAHEYTKLFRTWEKVRECGQTNGSGARSEARVREKMWKVRGVVESRKNTLARHEKTAYVSGV